MPTCHNINPQRFGWTVQNTKVKGYFGQRASMGFCKSSKKTRQEREEQTDRPCSLPHREREPPFLFFPRIQISHNSSEFKAVKLSPRFVIQLSLSLAEARSNSITSGKTL